MGAIMVLSVAANEDGIDIVTPNNNIVIDTDTLLWQLAVSFGALLQIASVIATIREWRRFRLREISPAAAAEVIPVQINPEIVGNVEEQKDTLNAETGTL